MTMESGQTGSRRLPKKSLQLLPLILFLSLSGVIGPLQLAHANVAWSSPTLIDSHSGINLLSSALQASNGTLWVAFESNRNAQTTGRFDVIYKTYTNGVWSTDHNLTMMGQNTSPSLIQLANGTIAVFWSLKLAQSYDINYAQYTPAGWTSPLQVTSTAFNDTSPSAAVGLDGTVWLVWTRINSTNPNNPAIKQIYYKTWKNGVWSSDVQLTTDSNQNYGGSVMVGKDGIVRVTFSKGVAGGTYQLYQKTYNGSVWTPDTQIVSSSSTDEKPSLMQDRNGTLWLFWGRLVVVSTLVQYYELFGKYSYNLGQTWSSETQLTPTPPANGPYFDSFQPAAVQSAYGVKPVWVFYTSNYNEPNYDIFAIQSSGIQNVHDLKITAFGAYTNLGTSWVYPGGFKSTGLSAMMTIKVTVTNIGDYVEMGVTMIVTATNTTNYVLGTVKNSIGPGISANFYYYWNTTNLKPGRYGLSANITSPRDESLGNMPDNYATVTNKAHVLPFGDVDQDGSVTITDVSQVLYDYNFTPACNCTRWNPYMDYNNNGVIDIVDVAVILSNYNTYT